MKLESEQVSSNNIKFDRIYARILECAAEICKKCEFNAEQIRALNVHL